MYFALLLIVAGSIYGLWTKNINISEIPVIFLLALVADQLYLIRDSIIRFGTASIMKKQSKEDKH